MPFQPQANLNTEPEVNLKVTPATHEQPVTDPKSRRSPIKILVPKKVTDQNQKITQVTEINQQVAFKIGREHKNLIYQIPATVVIQVALG